MKEDKENTKPREKKVEVKYEERAEKPEKKEKKEVLTKVVIRRLPPTLTKEQLEEQLAPLPEHDYFEFFSTNSSLFPHVFSRAYINFKNQDDIVLFRDQFDGYVFIDSKGQEYPAIVEFAPFQKIPKKKSKKKDAKVGTVEDGMDPIHFSDDPEYKKFLESYNNADDERNSNNPETLLEEIEAKTKELAAKKTTPLLDYVKNKQRIREEKREERRRRELEKRRLREEEKRKWREDERRKRREAEKQKKMLEKGFEKDKDRSKDEPKIKLLKKADKGDDSSSLEKPREKVKKLERERAKEDRPFTGQGKRLESTIKEDKGKKHDRVEDDSGRDYRDKEDRERERRLKDKERRKRQEEERWKSRERCEADKSFRKKDEEIKKENDQTNEKTRKKESSEAASSYDRLERGKEEKKEDGTAKKERIRNKDRPTMQLYQPGARSRSRLMTSTKSNDSSIKPPEASEEKKEEFEASRNIAEKESEE
ncbi:regulator of nonsense transcripts 3B [Chiloscyllium plagiosum]|uniref:regulator of nonsense transcripts 3B n=1 Tax=Chiloscyllium plagiosum TaxID=36176 RepID=UPI001CB82256|nr:regulator of nonsense transcripts 3B [Chiloscyllium plagiosum]